MPYLVGYVTPQDYGATGNGTTDDTAALQAAVTALGTAGGGTLYVPPATYALSAVINVPNEVSILGAGQGASILKQTSTTANVLSYAATNLGNIQVEKIQILGPGSGSGKGLVMSANGGVNPVVSCAFRDLVIENMGGNGMDIAVLITSTFENVEVVTCGNHGFQLSGGGTSVAMLNCYANGCGNHGYNLAQMNYTSLNGCAADSCVSGYFLDTCNNVGLYSCGTEANSGNAYVVTGGVGNSLVSCFVAQNNAIGAYFTGSTLSAFITGFRENAPHRQRHGQREGRQWQPSAVRGEHGRHRVEPGRQRHQSGQRKRVLLRG
jgi:hypothetical protein